MRLLAIALPIFISLTGCYYFQRASIPIETIHYSQKSTIDNDKQQRRLMVLLPGISENENNFYRFGVVDAIRNTNPDIDVIAVNAHFKYYQARTIIDRLREDIIKPALAAGYSEIYLGGISLGGFGSLLYLKQYPEDITKVFIMAPYLGEEQDYHYLLNKSEASHTAGADSIWPWLIALPDETATKIYLAYGTQDKFVKPNALLASYLLPKQIVVQNGEHNWKTWAQLWPQLLTKLP